MVAERLPTPEEDPSPLERVVEPPHPLKETHDEKVENLPTNPPHSAPRSGGAEMQQEGPENPPAHPVAPSPSPEPAPRIRVKFSTLQDEVMQNGKSPITFLQLLGMDGYIRRGRAHLLSGYPKTGKTELILRAIQEWGADSVLYFTEESQETWEDRAYELGKLEERIDNLELVFALELNPGQVLEIMRGPPRRL
jgi:hypothetical protein